VEQTTIVLILTGLLFIFFPIFVYIGIPFIHARYLCWQLARKAGRHRVMVLTFDDGPSKKLTPAILKILAQNHEKATFFLLGRNIAGKEEIVRQIAQQGHEICSHGYDHLHYWQVSPMRAINDIKQGWRAIDAALGSKGGRYIFRPPYGKINLIALLYLLWCRVPIVYWLVDSGDTWKLKPDSQRIAVLAEQAGGAVSLAHDFDRSNDSVDRFVLESTSSALEMAKRTGMTIITCSELLRR
jgi:peptidoglycan/xylan/chitin deacetylase (PgdA/CDA1 family)